MKTLVMIAALFTVSQSAFGKMSCVGTYKENNERPSNFELVTGKEEAGIRKLFTPTFGGHSVTIKTAIDGDGDFTVISATGNYDGAFGDWQVLLEKPLDNLDSSEKSFKVEFKSICEENYPCTQEMKGDDSKLLITVTCKK